jgi:hypothetical protein
MGYGLPGPRTSASEVRDQVNLLMKDLATDRAEVRARNARIADLES